MKQQLTECSAALGAGQGSSHDRLENFIMRDVTGMELMAALRNKVKQNDHDSQLIMETMKHIVNLSKAVIECQQQAREKEQQLMDIKSKRLSLKKAGGQKLLEIHTTMEEQKKEQASMEESKPLKKIQDKLKKEREIITVIQNVFQNIIIGSKVNWAEDPSLQAIVLQLEENVSFP
ncbi:centromere protein H [Pterocles gutturalis]